MSYKILTQKTVSSGEYSLVSYREKDMFDIMRWRNEQVDILRQAAPIKKSDQLDYYQKTIRPSFSNNNPNIMLFSLLKDGKCIGYGGLTNINWRSKRAEISFLLETARTKNDDVYRDDFTSFIRLIKLLAFEHLDLHRLFTETFDIRSFHVRLLEEAGFKLEGKMKEHVLIRGSYRDSLIHGLVNGRGNNV